MTSHGIDRDAPEWSLVGNLFAAHLHQDFDAAHGDAWGAVRDFASASSGGELEIAANGIRRLLTMFDDDEDLADAVDWLGMAYDPPSDGYTYRGWLEEVATFLEDRP